MFNQEAGDYMPKIGSESDRKGATARSTRVKYTNTIKAVYADKSSEAI